MKNSSRILKVTQHEPFLENFSNLVLPEIGFYALSVRDNAYCTMKYYFESISCLSLYLALLLIIEFRIIDVS
jgi:hypothetical protein